MTSRPLLELQEVFVLSGIPKYTFVQSIEYPRLLVALKTAARSIVVEGPSGIGKTTAVANAIAEAGLTERVLSLSARKRQDISLIAELPDQLPFGTVVIDDFHRLDRNLKQLIADLANRIEIIPFEANPEYKVAELIDKGEVALGARMNVRDDITP